MPIVSHFYPSFNTACAGLEKRVCFAYPSAEWRRFTSEERWKTT